MGDIQTLPVSEVFPTIQGEGHWTGTPAVFVRLQGCDVGCPWCDTKHTWSLDHREASFENLTVSALVARVEAVSGVIRHVVITGGEPLMHNIDPLIRAFVSVGYRVQVETSGTRPPPREQCWLTVSPKIGMPGGYGIDQECLRRADEIKHVIGKAAHARQLADLIAPLGFDGDLNGPRVYLQPVSMSAKATRDAVAECMARNWRLSVQTHKVAGIP